MTPSSKSSAPAGAVDPHKSSSLAPLAVLIHGKRGSIEWIRATVHLGLEDSISVVLLPREGGALSTWRQWRTRLRELRPRMVYVLNTAHPGVPLAAWLRVSARIPFVVDTGDLVFEMARRSGVEPRWRWPMLWAGERMAWRGARTIVVRSSCYRDYLTAAGYGRVEVIRDGFSPECAALPEAEVAALRRSLGWEGKFLVGVLGSLVYSPRLDLCYGWDLLHALAGLRDLPAHGVILGDGPGRGWLERLAVELKVQDRVTFLGRVPYDRLSRHLAMLDVALSTQTNNLPGQVRTTGKLPEYMAAGRYILASRVGEASRVLPEEMLVDYVGEVDRSYPSRLAQKIREAMANPEATRAAGIRNVELAHRLFGREVLRAKFDEVTELRSSTLE